ARVAVALREFASRSRNPDNGGAAAADVARQAALPQTPWPVPAERPGFSAIAETRAGIVQYLPQDMPVGDSIRWYGEYLQPQLDTLLSLIRSGATIVEVGAGVGIHSLALARAIGNDGQLILYESRPLHRRILLQN